MYYVIDWSCKLTLLEELSQFYDLNITESQRGDLKHAVCLQAERTVSSCGSQLLFDLKKTHLKVCLVEGLSASSSV